MRFQIKLIAYFLGIFCVGINAADAMDFIATKVGQELNYEGTIKINNDIKEMSMKIKVIEPYEHNGEKWIGHRIEVNSDDKKNVQIKYFRVDDDGIYCIAESKSESDMPKILGNPYLVIPIPPEPGKKWKVETKEGNKKLRLNYCIIKTGVDLEINGRTFKTVHITSEGTASIYGIDVPTKRDTWLVPEYGKLKQITTQTVFKNNTVAELELTLE